MRHQHHFHRVCAFAAFSALASALGGCSRIREKLVEKATEKAAEKMIEAQTQEKGVKVDIQTQDGKVVVTGKDGKAVTFAADKMPADFPKSVPIYPGAKVLGSMTSEAKQGVGGFITLSSSDPPEKVSAFYVDASSKGKSKTLDMQTPAGHMITWETADDFEASAVVSPAPTTGSASGQSQIVLTAGPKKSGTAAKAKK
jgi:hypothetical protein